MILATVVMPSADHLSSPSARAAHRAMLVSTAVARSRTNATGDSEEARYVAHAAGKWWISWEEGVIAVTGMSLLMVAN